MNNLKAILRYNFNLVHSRHICLELFMENKIRHRKKTKVAFNCMKIHSTNSQNFLMALFEISQSEYPKLV